MPSFVGWSQMGQVERLKEKLSQSEDSHSFMSKLAGKLEIENKALREKLAEREWVSVSLGDMYASDCWCGERAMLGISRVRGPEGCVDAVTNGRTFCERHWQPLPKPPKATPENKI